MVLLSMDYTFGDGIFLLLVWLGLVESVVT